MTSVFLLTFSWSLLAGKVTWVEGEEGRWIDLNDDDDTIFGGQVKVIRKLLEKCVFGARGDCVPGQAINTTVFVWVGPASRWPHKQPLTSNYGQQCTLAPPERVLFLPAWYRRRFFIIMRTLCNMQRQCWWAAEGEASTKKQTTIYVTFCLFKCTRSHGRLWDHPVCGGPSSGVQRSVPASTVFVVKLNGFDCRQPLEGLLSDLSAVPGRLAGSSERREQLGCVEGWAASKEGQK